LNLADIPTIITWGNFQIVIPLIVVLVTLIYNAGKEKRDRNYQFRPVPLFLTLNDLRPEKKEGCHILYNEEILPIDNQNGGHFFKITNISDPPMLSVTINIRYKDNFPEQKYQILLIEKEQTFIIPISNVDLRNDKSEWKNELKDINITYRSLSGQKYSATSSWDGKVNVIAKNKLFLNEKIISTNRDRKSRFVKY
jgi:hypothetical protein